MVLLSRFPVTLARDFTGLLWRDLPGAVQPTTAGAPFPSAKRKPRDDRRALGRALGGGGRDSRGSLTLMTFAATPPVLGGREDLTGYATEARSGSGCGLDDDFGRPPVPPLAIIGLADLLPRSAGGRTNADPTQAGDPVHDTAD